MLSSPLYSAQTSYRQSLDEEIFFSLLSDHQRNVFCLTGGFRGHGIIPITGSLGGTYLLKCQSSSFNIIKADDPSTTYCASCRRVPPYDSHLAIKIWIETDEAAFLAVANRGCVSLSFTSRRETVREGWKRDVEKAIEACRDKETS